jgi:hypothetical protein
VIVIHVPGIDAALDYVVAHWPDIINGSFEALGGFFILLSVLKLHRAKCVSGVSYVHVAFFSAWGYWNLYFYPHLDQWLSFWGGLFLVATNTWWLGQIVYYNRWPGGAALYSECGR